MQFFSLPRNLSEEQVVYNNLDINIVIPAKAGIQERHLETTLSGFPRSSRLRGNDRELRWNDDVLYAQIDMKPSSLERFLDREQNRAGQSQIQIRRQRALYFWQVNAAALGQVDGLVGADFAYAEVGRLRVAEVKAADAGRRGHGVAGG